MYSGTILAVLVFFFLLFIAYQKRRMLFRLFSIDAAAPADQFQAELKQTADTVIEQLENRLAHLEYLLEEADEKINILNEKIQAAEQVSERLTPPVSQAIRAYQDAVKSREPAPAADIGEPSMTVLEDDEPERTAASQEKRKMALDMAEAGYNVTEIAKATGLGKGEVMLLLQLNKK